MAAAVSERLVQFAEGLPSAPAVNLDDVPRLVAGMREPAPEQGSELDGLLDVVMEAAARGIEILVLDQTRGLEHREMLRDRRPRDRQTARKLADRPRPRGEALENLPPGRIGERSKRGCGVSHRGDQAARSPAAGTNAGVKIGNESCTLLRAMCRSR